MLDVCDSSKESELRHRVKAKGYKNKGCNLKQNIGIHRVALWVADRWASDWKTSVAPVNPVC